MSFAQDMLKFAKKTNSNILEVRKAVFFDLAKQIIVRTPVDTGRARGNWQPNLHNFSSGVVGGVKHDPMPDVRKVADSARGDDSLTLVNNLPYIHKLEYGGYGKGPKTRYGYSRQAPYGMVRITVASYKKSMRKAVAGVR